jgi:hypothetical protein
MDGPSVDEYLEQQELSPDQIERAKRLLEETSLSPAEAAFAVALADGESDGDILRDRTNC